MEDNDDLTKMMKKKNELLRRIEENKRLMELIRNPKIKDTLGPLLMMKKNIAVKKIQKYWRIKRTKNKIPNKIVSQIIKLDKKNNVIDVNFKITLIQRAVRIYFARKSKDKLTSHYVNEFNGELFSPLRFDRVISLKNEMISKIKSKEIPGKNIDFQEILNEYFLNYKKYNDEFPDHVKLRNENVSKYYQCMSLVNHMSTITNLEDLSKFDGFYIDSHKKDQIRSKLNTILNSVDHNMWWYKYRDMDDFEENNIINEVDSLFNFERMDDILSRRKKI